MHEAPRGPGAPSDKNGSFLEWGNPRAAASCSLSYDIMNQPDVFNIGAGSVFVRCADKECLDAIHCLDYFNSSPVFNSLGRALPLNDIVRGSQDVARREGERIPELLGPLMFTVQIGLPDLVYGVDAKLREVLKRLKTTDKEVTFLQTCICKVIGSDVGDFVKRMGPGATLHKNTRGALQHESRSKLAARLRSGTARGARRSINLIGFEKMDGLAGATASLERIFGIRRNVDIFPGAYFHDRLEDFQLAGLNVVNGTERAIGFFRELPGAASLPSVVVPPPFGMRGSLDWIATVAGRLGCDLRKGAWLRYRSAMQRRWRAVRVEASACRLGFLVDASLGEMLLQPARHYFGIPLLDCLSEMGFALDLGILDPESLGPLADRLRADRRLADRSRARLLAGLPEAAAWLQASPCASVYSDIPDDELLLARGKNVFSSFLFDYGPEGALETAERVLASCRTPFYRKYPMPPAPGKPLPIGYADAAD